MGRNRFCRIQVGMRKATAFCLTYFSFQHYSPFQVSDVLEARIDLHSSMIATDHRIEYIQQPSPI
jgi:hypothetical protein